MDIKYIRGNIINIPADAIVLPANEKLKKGNGASESIFKAAGEKELAQACKRIGSCAAGCAAATMAYKLDAKYIVHAVVPKWIDGKHGEYNTLSSAYIYALHVADKLECRSIAFPLLASGNNGFNLDLAIEIAIESIKSFQASSLESVMIILYGEHAVSTAKKHGAVLSLPPVDKRAIDNPEYVPDLGDRLGEAAQNFIDNALEMLNDKDVQRTILLRGVDIAEKALLEAPAKIAQIAAVKKRL